MIPDIGAVRVQDLPSYGGSRDSSRILYSARTQLEQLGPPDYGRELSYDPGQQCVIICYIYYNSVMYISSDTPTLFTSFFAFFKFYMYVAWNMHVNCYKFATISTCILNCLCAQNYI